MPLAVSAVPCACDSAPGMTTAAWVLLAAAAVAAVTDWWAVARAAKPVEYLAKPATLLLLVGVALALVPLHDDRRAWFVAALVLSTLGDVFLMLPQDRFVFGLGSFLLAHVAYVAGYALHAGSAGAIAVAAVAMVAAGAYPAVRIVGALRDGGHASLVGPVVAYMTVISAMVAMALATGNPLAGAGAALFYTSDLLIAWNRFVRPMVWAPVAIIVTYHVGQALIATSLVR